MSSSEDIISYYKERKQVSDQHLIDLGKRINLLVFLRLLSFLCAILSMVFFWSTPGIAVLASVISLAAFGFFIKQHLKNKEQQSYWKALSFFYGNEILGEEKGDWSFADGGEDYQIPNHDFANDIDLFGPRSFFQRVNKTSLKGGAAFLADMMLSNDPSQVIKLQEANQELREKKEFLEAFIGNGRIQETVVSPVVTKNWIRNYKPFLGDWLKVLLFGFPILSVVVLVGFSLGWLSGTVFTITLVSGLILVGIWLKRINAFGGAMSQIVASIKSYDKMLLIIEEESFQSERLKSLKSQVDTEHHKASQVINRLSRNIDLFNNRNNLLVAILGNGLLLWDVQTVFRLENWIKKHGAEVIKWLDVLYELDALCSLSVYANNHSDYTYPILDGDTNISAVKLGHPLIKKEVCVVNDVNLSPSSFFIITGANMAGKSTFLRTVALSILMTNLGLPVFAESLKIKPQKLITSMRSSDSLLEDESYFFAELKRLKHIVEKLDKQPYFVILDEILKGTNSKDKEEGSKKFVRRLVQMKATGIIATHDLGLCTIAEDLTQVSNYYFDAEIVNDELFFDYKMKDGVCKNMNASFLLKKMNIVPKE